MNWKNFEASGYTAVFLSHGKCGAIIFTFSNSKRLLSRMFEVKIVSKRFLPGMNIDKTSAITAEGPQRYNNVGLHIQRCLKSSSTCI